MGKENNRKECITTKEGQTAMHALLNILGKERVERKKELVNEECAHEKKKNIYIYNRDRICNDGGRAKGDIYALLNIASKECVDEEK